MRSIAVDAKLKDGKKRRSDLVGLRIRETPGPAGAGMRSMPAQIGRVTLVTVTSG
jgi:hypothetical protein